MWSYSFSLSQFLSFSLAEEAEEEEEEEESERETRDTSNLLTLVDKYLSGEFGLSCAIITLQI